jgi:hypothetical protein
MTGIGDFPGKDAFDAVWIVNSPDGWLVIAPRRQAWIFADLAAARAEAIHLARGFDLPVCEALP